MLALQVREKIERLAQTIGERSALLALAQRGGISTHVVELYLVDLRYLFSSSHQNLMRAAELCEREARDLLAEYFRRKVDEERGHERWAEDDLARLPGMRGDRLEPSSGCRAIVALQGRLIQRDPFLFAVYVLWAEYFTVLMGDRWLEALSCCGFDRGQLSALSKHIDADRDHAAHALEELDRLAAGSVEAATVSATLEECAQAFEAWFGSIHALAARVA